MREDTVASKVYAATVDAQNNVTERLYLNFGLKLNDTINDGYDRYRVVSVDSTIVDSIYHKVFRISKIGGGYSWEVIENIHNYQLLSMSYLWISLKCFFNKGQRPVIDTMEQNNQNDCSDTALSIREVQQETPNLIKVYPQPANKNLTIELAAPILGGVLIIINTTGQVVYKKTIHTEMSFLVNSDFPQGLYFYRITDNTTGNIYSGKLLFAN